MPGKRQFLYPLKGAAVLWTPASPTTDGAVSPHTWHYAGSGGLWQESGKTTPAVSDGDAIGASENQGSDSHDIVQATSANKPTLKLNILNGQPVYRVDGTDYLQGAFGGALGQPFTIFLVAALDAGAVNDGLRHNAIDGDDVTNRIIMRQNPDGTDFWNVYAGGHLSNGNSDANWNLWTALINGASSELWFSGISAVTGNAGAMNPDGLSLGAAYNGATQWVGDISEVLIYDPNLSTADMNQVGQYLATKYGLSWTAIT